MKARICMFAAGWAALATINYAIEGRVWMAVLLCFLGCLNIYVGLQAAPQGDE